MKKISAKDLDTDREIDLITGYSMSRTNEIPEFGIPSAYLADGTNGVRVWEGGDTVCYPCEAAVAATWNCGLAEKLGEYIGDECAEKKVDMLLAPAINIKRTPLCGRNFEYYSEDPCLTAELAAAFVQGVQSTGVAACVKHFAAYNTEIGTLFGRNSEVDERTLREIYLKAFEKVIEKSAPAAVMAAYNRLNGIYCCENEFLLQKVLRQEWGYEGLVVSDWGAIHNRVNSLKAGVDLEMPAPACDRRAEIKGALASGNLPKEYLDRAAEHMLRFAEKYTKAKKAKGYAYEKRRALAREIAEESITLLKNEGGILPIAAKTYKKIAVIGELAKIPAYQGGGCAHVQSEYVSAYSCLEKFAQGNFELKYCRGYDSASILLDGALLNEAVSASRDADAVLFFIGNQHNLERETFNRTDLGMMNNMLQVLDYVLRNNENVIVVVQAGSAVDLRLFWRRAKAILMQWYAGDLGGEALVNVLTGAVNPSGKLAETFPANISEIPAFESEHEFDNVTLYSEGILTGYRYYDTKRKQPLCEFGYGLSYTEYVYSDLCISPKEGGVRITFKVRNAGKMDGAEIVQVYTGNKSCRMAMPEKELKAFGKKKIRAGEEEEFSFDLKWEDLAVYVPSLGAWHTFGGTYDVYIGASSRDIRLRGRVTYENARELT